MRDKENGKIISLAPNLDNNVSLISRDIDLTVDPKDDDFIKFFTDFCNNNIRVNEYFKEIKFPELSINDLETIIKKINIDKDIDSDMINDYVLKRYRYLLNYLK